MAERMKGRLRGACCTATTVAALLWASTGVAAELRDPTRPPSAAEVAAPAGAARAPATAAALTAIRIDANQRVATIGGHRIKVGDRLGDGSVRAIGRTEVVLATPSGNQVLKLFPGVQQRARDAASPGGTRLARLAGARPANPKLTDGGATPAPLQGEPQ